MIMRSGIRSLFTSRTPRTVRKAPASFRPALEDLEDRTVLDNTLPVGGGQPIDISQPSLTLRYIIAEQGVFPSRNGGAVQDEPYLGEVLLFGGDFAPDGWAFCDGQLLSIDENQALFNILGTTYGGNGQTTFALPDLRGRAAVEAGAGLGLPNVALGQQYGAASTTLNLTQVPQHAAPLADGGSTGVTGGSQPVNIQNPSLGLNYIIAVQGIFPSQNGGGGNVPLLGEIRLFAGDFAPGGWALCDGQLLSIAQNTALFSILGTTYGGNGTTNFALPNLQGRNPIGTGQGVGLSNVVLGQDVGNASVTLTVSQLPVHTYPLPPNGNQTTGPVGGGQAFANDQPALGLNYILAEQGVFPPQDPEPMIGDVRLFAGNFAPSGFALCQGQLLPIDQYTALFSILGTTYGGNGMTTFALPDLRGRAAVEAGQGPGLSNYDEGDSYGQDSIQLTIDQLPSESLPLPVLALSVTADNPTVNAGGTAGFTVTVNNTGPSPSVAAAATLSDPLPALGSGNLWSINTHAPGTNPGEFELVGTAGNQVLELIAGAALQSNTPQAVDVTGVTTPSLSPTATLTTTATLDSPDVTVRNLTRSATITVISQQPAFAGLSSATITYGTPTTTLTGNLAAGGSGIAGASVSITLNSVVQTATTDSSGYFTTTFNTAALGVAGSPYPVTYAFAGDSNYPPATDNSTTETVTKATPTVQVSDAGGVYTDNPFPATATVTGVSGTPSSSLEGVTPSLTYYTGSTASGTPLPGAPTAVGTYTVLASFAGSADYQAASNTATFAITQTAITGFAVSWGSSGSAALNLPATSGGLLLPTGRKTDLPWLGIDHITLTLGATESLTASDITISSAIGANYGPITVTDSGTTVTIMLASAIDQADRVTIGISGSGIASFSGQLAVLPGDVNDVGVVNVQDLVAVEQQWLGVVPATIFGDITGDGKPSEADYLAVRQRIGTSLPPPSVS